MKIQTAFVINFVVALAVGTFVRLGFDRPEWWQICLAAIGVGLLGILMQRFGEIDNHSGRSSSRRPQAM
jgi:hypothetical protein